MEEQVLSQLNMTQKTLDDGVQHLNDWIKKQPHLPHCTDENFWKGFIIGSKSIERCKVRLDRYFSARTKFKAIYGNRDPTTLVWPSIQKIVDMPELTKENYKVTFAKIPSSKEDVAIFSLEETLRYYFMVIDYGVRHQPFVSGSYVVYDCKDFPIEMVIKFTSLHTAAAADIYQTALPLRAKLMVWINAPSLAVTFYNTFVKYLFSEKLRKRIIIHTEDHRILTKYIPLELIPKDYGGYNKSIEHLFEETKKALASDKDWFLNEGSLGTDESRRPRPDNNSQQLHGTFTKLNID